jgi:hypothetical protein
MPRWLRILLIVAAAFVALLIVWTWANSLQ